MSSDHRRSLTALAEDLGARRSGFARVTVVRAQPPTSAHAGDGALVTADGQVHGFVGGQCAAESVRKAGLDAIAAGADLLLRILPQGADPFPETPGARVVVNPCMSGGAIELFIEPRLPAPIIHVVGNTPIAWAVIDQARLLGFEVAHQESVPSGEASGVGPDDAVASIIATHGGDESGLIWTALGAGVPFVGLVASRRRGSAVLDAMELTASQRDTVHTPAGVDIGAVTPPEIALSVLAQVVSAIRRDGISATRPSTAITRSEADSAPRSSTIGSAIDPICGMTVQVSDDTPEVADDAGRHWFCCVGCKDTYLARSGGGLQAVR